MPASLLYFFTLPFVFLFVRVTLVFGPPLVIPLCTPYVYKTSVNHGSAQGINKRSIPESSNLQPQPFFAPSRRPCPAPTNHAPRTIRHHHRQHNT